VFLGMGLFGQPDHILPIILERLTTVALKTLQRLLKRPGAFLDFFGVVLDLVKGCFFAFEYQWNTHVTS
jgi:hypothetical protein